MRSLLIAVCLAFVVTLVPSTAAVACIWDRGTVQMESEFKKHYEFKSGYKEPESVSPVPEKSWAPVAAGWSGAGLLFAAIGLVSLNVYRSNRA